MGFMLAPIQSRVTIPLFCPASPFGRTVPLPSLSLPHSRSFSSLVLRIPFNSLPNPSLASSSPCRTVVYISREEVSHTTDSRQFSHLESQNFSLPRLPSSLFPSVPTLPPFFRPWPPLWLPSASPVTPSIYTCIPVHFVSTRSVAHASPLLLLLPLFLPLPSAPSGSARARSRGPFPSRLSISSSQAAGRLVLLVLFAPFRFTTGAGRLCSLPRPRSSPARPLRGCSPFCIVRLPRTPSFSLTLLLSSRLRRAPSSFPRRSFAARFLALSDTRSSRSRPLREAEGEKGGLCFYKWFQPRTGAGVMFRVIGCRLCHAATER